MKKMLAIIIILGICALGVVYLAGAPSVSYADKSSVADAENTQSVEAEAAQDAVQKDALTGLPDDLFIDNVSEDQLASTDEEVDAIKFRKSEWSSGLLRRVEAGPSLLPADLDFDVAPPPPNSSAVTKAELEYLEMLKETKRDGATLNKIGFEYTGVRPREMFQHYGLIAEQNYKTVELLDILDLDVTWFILERKLHFSRPRPSKLSDNLDLPLPNPTHAAYPSGHSGQTYAAALVLSDFDPENAELYKNLSRNIAHRREIGGWHYPSDSEAGRKLATKVLAELRKIPVFEKKYQDAKISYIKPKFDENGDVVMPVINDEADAE